MPVSIACWYATWRSISRIWSFSRLPSKTEHAAPYFFLNQLLHARGSLLMQKRKRSTRPRAPYPEQQLLGLQAHTQAQKQSTAERLRTAITTLTAQHKPISARTIYEECGLEYASLRRNPEALLLYQQHSTFLKQKRKRAKVPHPDAPAPRDPRLSYKKTDLVARVRKTEELLQAR